MGCSPSLACRAARQQLTAIHPNRDQLSDGICGDEAHQARVSDHNVGNAVDITHDPPNGVDCHILAEDLRARCEAGHESRVTYIIWARRICAASTAWRWRAYTGQNPHTRHMHISIKAASRNDTRPWWVSQDPPTPPSASTNLRPSGDTIVTKLPTLRRGASGQHVRNAQALLVGHARAIKIDGDYGPATESTVRAFQSTTKIGADGVIGPATWAKLLDV